jgi:hypothetical protein
LTGPSAFASLRAVRSFKLSQLEVVASFSIADSLGHDTWTLYRPRSGRRVCVVRFDQTVRGWESERWSVFGLNGKARSIYEVLVASTGTGLEKRALLEGLALDDASVDTSG